MQMFGLFNKCKGKEAASVDSNSLTVQCRSSRQSTSLLESDYLPAQSNASHGSHLATQYSDKPPTDRVPALPPNSNPMIFNNIDDMSKAVLTTVQGEINDFIIDVQKKCREAGGDQLIRVAAARLQETMEGVPGLIIEIKVASVPSR
ncbi:hypothetical protein [Cardinium endosymbiont of Tipula unca]|uniref:hypothetical protein n=1 Tax=Cardinium endosymbiont of Tipula unca TaxID=3066216 RepID=UPI0030CD169D